MLGVTGVPAGSFGHTRQQYRHSPACPGAPYKSGAAAGDPARPGQAILRIVEAADGGPSHAHGLISGR